MLASLASMYIKQGYIARAAALSQSADGFAFDSLTSSVLHCDLRCLKDDVLLVESARNQEPSTDRRQTSTALRVKG